MGKDIVIAADAIAMFCRLQMNTRKELPIRSSEMGVLIYIQKSEEAVTPLMISNFFHITKPSVTTMINELIRKNYLVKERSTTDRRSYTISITEKGKSLVSSAHEEYFKTMDILQKKMGSNDFDLFIKLISKANCILKEEKNQ